jgi:hypothetical protein
MFGVPTERIIPYNLCQTILINNTFVWNMFFKVYAYDQAHLLTRFKIDFRVNIIIIIIIIIIIQWVQRALSPG